MTKNGEVEPKNASDRRCQTLATCYGFRMPQLFTVPAGGSLARCTARHLLTQGEAATLARSVIFLPNRRACRVMRQAFEAELQGAAALLPRMLPLAEIENEIPALLGPAALGILAGIPAAMDETQQRYLLARQVAAYERRRMGAVTLHYALTLADALMQLQENCIRAGIVMTQEKLRQLYYADYAEHWREALLFLGILTDTWPQIEQALGLTTRARREVQMFAALAEHWQHSPPDFPVIAVGSTASQPVTAALLQSIANLPTGQVVLPGLDVTMDDATWAKVAAGHPLFHVKQFLQLWPVTPAQVTPLVPAKPGLWLAALAPAEQFGPHGTQALPEHDSLRLIPCAHPEEEVRVISLLLREGLENSAAQVALITPDEGLMARVATHMQRYGITVDRLNAGMLAGTQTGSLWVALVAAAAQPDRLLPLRELLHHPLLAVDTALLQGLEKGWYGLNRGRAGQLPRHEASLHEHAGYAALAARVDALATLARQTLRASEWVAAFAALLAPWQQAAGQGHEAVGLQLDGASYADDFGAMGIEDFSALLAERLSAKWRDAGLNTHPRLHLLTPVEARLQCFDRVILANMQEAHWPGSVPISPWLNRAAETALGLPTPEEHISRMAHDVLMLASHGEVFLTYPKRDGGSPTARSRFIERLLTLLAMHGVEEAQITADQYTRWAQDIYASAHYAPEPPATPRPESGQRPRRLSATDMDRLFSDPFAIYARYVLGLRAIDPLDADPQASDFGSLTHRALEQLTGHWNSRHAPASEAQLQEIAQDALRQLSEQPNIDLFWRTRLLGGLRYVNALEAERRTRPLQVDCEQVIEAAIEVTMEDGAHVPVTLHGRIDRLETRAGGLTIIDYKTGKIPSESAILEGRALQLMVYAMLLEKTPAVVERVEYWQLPRLGDTGELLQVPTGEILAALEEKLRAALAQMLDARTPFLARPMGGSSDNPYENAYDGVSRYDEWAG